MRAGRKEAMPVWRLCQLDAVVGAIGAMAPAVQDAEHDGAGRVGRAHIQRIISSQENARQRLDFPAPRVNPRRVMIASFAMIWVSSQDLLRPVKLLA